MRSPLPVLFAFVLPWAVACDDAHPEDVVQAARRMCATRNESTCASDKTCRPIYGWAPEAYCATRNGPSEYAGCGPAADCPPAVRMGRSPDGTKTLIFPAGCVPSGWTGDYGGSCADAASP